MKSTTFAVYVLWENAVQLQLELLCVYRQDFGLGHVPGSVDVVLFCLFFYSRNSTAMQAMTGHELKCCTYFR